MCQVILQGLFCVEMVQCSRNQLPNLISGSDFDFVILLGGYVLHSCHQQYVRIQLSSIPFKGYYP